MDYDAPPDWLDRDMVLNFFWKFSVFECALKREGFLNTDRSNGAVPDWDSFGKLIRGRFEKLKITGFQEAVELLMNKSPRRQIVRNGRLEWESLQRRSSESSEEFVLRLVRATRNNLFHGGKYPDGPVTEVAHDKAILKAALKILQGCYELHPDISRWTSESAEQDDAQSE